MRNNFAIYCGLAMVHCRCYIGLECTILFSSESHSVGCGPLRPPAHSYFFQQQSMLIGSEPPKVSCPFDGGHFWGNCVNTSTMQHFTSFVFFKCKSKNKTDGVETEFHHSVFLNSYRAIAPLGIPLFQICSLKGRTDANIREKLYTFFPFPVIVISQTLVINLS